MKILVLGAYDYGNPWRATYPDAEIVLLNTHNPITKPLNLVQYSAIQFTGGYDVSPALYGEANTHSQCNAERDSQSDAERDSQCDAERYSE